MKALLQGLRRTRERFFGSIQHALSGDRLDAAVIEELEGVLLGADIGFEATQRIIDRLRERSGTVAAAGECRRVIAAELRSIFGEAVKPRRATGTPRVIVVIGVNGVGKTSTIGKLAYRFAREGSSVLVAACDTFRAAAIDQLELWATRAGVPLVRQRMGSDPAAVAFDAVQAARARGADVVIVDTAGRLHTRINLMEELKKIFTVLSTRMEGISPEGWLVLDANIGQNSLQQAEAFTASLPVTGLVLTKLDSTAKGGAVIAIQQKLGIPILYVGLGEGIDDLAPFDADEFVAGIIGD